MPFRLPTRIHFGRGIVSDIATVIADHGCQRILLVTDNGLQQTPWPDTIREALEDALCEVTVASSIEANPRHSTIDTLAEEARHNGAELVIGLGGGSVLDAGKAIAMLLRNAGSCLDYEGKNVFHNGSAPFIAIPTTCGTGSEVTWVSVISNLDEHRKVSVKGDAMFPADALVDPDLIQTLPPSLIAATGMDAFTHAIEAYTCSCSNPISDALAEKAMILLNTYLPVAFRNIENTQARVEVMRASTLAGMAFGNADVAGVHCLSESLGGLYDIPHGLANAVLLAPVMAYHRPVIKGRLAAIYSLLTDDGVSDPEQTSSRMIEHLQDLSAQLDIPLFSSFTIPIDDYEQIAQAAVTNNSNGSNPQPMTQKDYLSILNTL